MVQLGRCGTCSWNTKQVGGLPRSTLEGHKPKRWPPDTTLKLPAGALSAQSVQAK